MDLKTAVTYWLSLKDNDEHWSLVDATDYNITLKSISCNTYLTFCGDENDGELLLRVLESPKKMVFFLENSFKRPIKPKVLKTLPTPYPNERSAFKNDPEPFKGHSRDKLIPCFDWQDR